eukprot:gnl/TRDRNA2_/TRDRNA2_75575_c0_seq1.p2 gnl/TRDRNA2_/TRDRNA2_75575_c0~~gnl/TRDRNA2_/TRDRNA2_75575_c0_seq1.p2  ORF type:complete len:127 (-),score=4.13 gnl/TRDRNA2_/TRDRNA2_75575_c0_seq1:55-435(-)
MTKRSTFGRPENKTVLLREGDVCMSRDVPGCLVVGTKTMLTSFAEVSSCGFATKSDKDNAKQPALQICAGNIGRSIHTSLPRKITRKRRLTGFVIEIAIVLVAVFGCVRLGLGFSTDCPQEARVSK